MRENVCIKTIEFELKLEVLMNEKINEHAHCYEIVIENIHG